MENYSQAYLLYAKINGWLLLILLVFQLAFVVFGRFFDRKGWFSIEKMAAVNWLIFGFFVVSIMVNFWCGHFWFAQSIQVGGHSLSFEVNWHPFISMLFLFKRIRTSVFWTVLICSLFLADQLWQWLPNFIYGF